MNCPDCNHNRVTTEYTDHYVPCTLGDLIGVTIRIPVRLCLICGGKWLDHKAEDIISNVFKRIK